MTEYHDDPDYHGDDDDMRGIDPPEGKTHDGEPIETFPEEPDAPAPAHRPNPPKKYVGKLLTLKEAAERLGISYPTATRLTAKYGDKIPSVGEGRQRRYPLAALAVMKELRGEQPKAGRPKVKKATKAPRFSEARKDEISALPVRIEIDDAAAGIKITMNNCTLKGKGASAEDQKKMDEWVEFQAGYNPSDQLREELTPAPSILNRQVGDLTLRELRALADAVKE